MLEEQPQQATYKTSISEKAAYTRALQKKLSETESRLAGVDARIRSATMAQQLVVTRQLSDAQRAVDANLAAVRSSLERLRKSSDKGWKKQIRDVDTSWENLSLSIKRLVAGYSDGKK